MSATKGTSVKRKYGKCGDEVNMCEKTCIYLYTYMKILQRKLLCCTNNIGDETIHI